MTCHHHPLSLSLLSAQGDIPGSSCTSPASTLDQPFLREPWFFLEQNVLESQDFGANCAYCYWGVMFPGPLYGQSQETHTHIHTYNSLSIYLASYLSSIYLSTYHQSSSIFCLSIDLLKIMSSLTVLIPVNTTELILVCSFVHTMSSSPTGNTFASILPNVIMEE